MSFDSRQIQDAFTSMLRTDYISLKDTERLNLLSRYYVDYFGYIGQIVAEQDQLVVGRRGTGKTTLLYRGLIECMASWTDQGSAAKPRTLGIYLDLSKCQLVNAGSPGDFRDFEHLVVSEICDAISEELTRSWPDLRDQPGLFARLFESVEQKKLQEVRGLLSKLAAILTKGKPRFFQHSGKIDTRELGKTSIVNEQAVRFDLSPDKAGVGGSSGSKQEVAAEYEERANYEVTYRLSIADIVQIVDELRTAANCSESVLLTPISLSHKHRDVDNCQLRHRDISEIDLQCQAISRNPPRRTSIRHNGFRRLKLPRFAASAARRSQVC